MRLFDGTLRTEGDFVGVADGATVILDGVAWDVNRGALGIGVDPGGLRTYNGTVVVRNGATINVSDLGIIVGDWSGTEGTLRIESGAVVTAQVVLIGNDAGSRGAVIVTGSGSTLTTVGTDNRVTVGEEGTGTLNVLDGGLVETILLDVATSGVGRVFIGGVAEDGTRSRVVVSPAHGRLSGIFADEAGLVRVAHFGGSNGRIEIRDGGMLRVLDGNGTHGPALQIARNKGSVGTVIVDGPGSSLEVIQNGPAVHGNPNVASGPFAQLGRRGGGTTVIRNGGRLLVRGESAFVRVSQDSTFSQLPDPDPGPINQQSVVRIESGGRLEIDGAGAQLVIGDSGPAADGVVTVSGPGSVLSLTGAENRLVVGDDGGRGRLDVYAGGSATYGELVIGARGVVNISSSKELQDVIDAVVGELLPPQDAVAGPGESSESEDADETEGRTGEGDNAREEGEQQETGDDEETNDEEAEEDDEEGEETAGVGERGDEEQEELPMCPA